MVTPLRCSCAVVGSLSLLRQKTCVSHIVIRLAYSVFSQEEERDSVNPDLGSTGGERQQ
jgi:hypothetical protein